MDHRHRAGRPWTCSECGIARGVANARGLHQHDPEYLRRWALGLAASAMAAMAEADTREAAGADAPDVRGRKVGDPSKTSRPQMRRNRQVRENQLQTLTGGPP